MESDILKLLYDYGVNNQFADQNYILKLIEIVVNSKSLNNYVNNVQWYIDENITNNSGIKAYYDFFSFNISINTYALDRSLSYQNEIHDIFTDIEYVFYKNLIITQWVLHELEHAKQNIKLDLDFNNLETKLLKASFINVWMLKNANVNVNGEYENLNLDLLNANKQNYLDFHKQIPGERFAQIQSYKIILKVLKEIKHIVPTLYKTEKQLLVNEMLEGYMPSIDKIDSPTKYFLANSCEENLHLLKSLNVFDDNVKEKYKLSKRLVYGLPISNEEYYYTRRLTY